MDIEELNYYYSKFKYGEDISHALMPFRVREVLLVSTFYDAFIFEQDGRLSEQIVGEFHQLNLSSAPRITSVPTAADALRLVETQDFDLVITMMRIGSLTPFELARQIKEKKGDLPVLLLLNVRNDIIPVKRSEQLLEHIDNVFFWNGDSKIFLAMTKYIEDVRNAEHDTEVGLVRIILLVEDSVSFYSRYLPELYREVMLQVQRLVSEELADHQKAYRMRTRPKVLMAKNFEEAKAIIDRYEQYLLCVITDLSFPRRGEIDDEAGFRLVRYLQRRKSNVPIAMQTSHAEKAPQATAMGLQFLNKGSEALIDDLRDFIHAYLGFGEFIFRDKHGNILDWASSMEEFEQKLQHISDECLLYHSSQNHFSTWLLAHGANRIAKKVRKLSASDFNSVSELRRYTVEIFRSVRQQKNRGRLVDYKASVLTSDYEIARMCEGSLGGKGRGVAFLNALLATMNYKNRFPGLEIGLPPTVLVGTGEYDWFLNAHQLKRRVLHTGLSDLEIRQLFLEAPLSLELQDKLKDYLSWVHKPLAVRSSGLLEDSQSQPFAGVYESFMLPNNHPNLEMRLKHLMDAIRMVFASTLSQTAQDYVRRTSNQIGDEKMAVMIQEVVGEQYGDYYYPHISGVTQSYNYYPTSYMKHDDGVAMLALGMGAWIVGGNPTLRFCPKYPRMQMLSPEILVKTSQSSFYAIDMRRNDIDLLAGEMVTLVTLPLSEAEKHGTLEPIASVWDPRDERMRDGLGGPGRRVLTFANILHHGTIPLDEAIADLLQIGEVAFGVPVEMEFAVNLTRDRTAGVVPRLYLLQIRPLSVRSEAMLTAVPEWTKEEVFLHTTHGMGNGVISDLHDIIFVEQKAFVHTETLAMLEEIRVLNEELPDDASFLLIGPGRWGSRDRFLGIPVRWADISKARVIVEVALDKFAVEGSQGTHFFHNLVAMNGGYLTVPLNEREGFIDWEWLNAQEVVKRTKYFVHIHRDKPFIVKLYGRDGTALIYKDFDEEGDFENDGG